MSEEQNISNLFAVPQERIRQSLEKMLDANQSMEGLYRVTSLDVRVETKYAPPRSAQAEILPDAIPAYLQTQNEVEFDATADRIPLFYKESARISGTIEYDGTIRMKRMVHEIHTPRPAYGVKEWHVDG